MTDRTSAEILPWPGNVRPRDRLGRPMHLEPDLTSTMTHVKLALVLVIGLNGVVATGMHRALVHRPTMRLAMVGMGCASISQVGWWGATVIGFINAH